MTISIREEALLKNSFDFDKKIFFLDFSEYNEYKEIDIKIFLDIIKTHYYVEVVSSRRTNWTLQVRSFRTNEANHWYNYILRCPVCNKNIFRIYKNKGICKLNHRNNIYNLIPKFLKISSL